jgi:flagellar hook-associated protein 1
VAGGPAGFETLVKRILNHTFGVTLKDDGTPHSPAFQNTFLGPEGNLTSTIPSYARLADFAAAVVAAQTAERADATAQREAEGATRDLVRNRLADEAGVNIDAEMSLMVQLQQAYQANARVLQTSRDMYDALFAATNR